MKQIYKRILIIDDSETSRMIIRRCLSLSGLDESEFFEAEDGIHALGLLADGALDLVVTDLNMPRMDGWTLIKKIRRTEHTRLLPVLIISSVAAEGLEAQMKELNVLGLVHKPVTPAKIARALEAADAR